MELGPPPPPTMLFRFAFELGQTVLSVVLVAVAAHESFQGTSWIYPKADSLPVPFAELQNVGVCVPTSSKSVPPTATLNGVEANPLTASPSVAAASVLKLSHPAAPGSPDAIVTVSPCAAACSQRTL